MFVEIFRPNVWWHILIRKCSQGIWHDDISTYWFESVRPDVTQTDGIQREGGCEYSRSALIWVLPICTKWRMTFLDAREWIFFCKSPICLYAYLYKMTRDIPGRQIEGFLHNAQLKSDLIWQQESPAEKWKRLLHPNQTFLYNAI